MWSSDLSRDLPENVAQANAPLPRVVECLQAGVLLHLLHHGSGHVSRAPATRPYLHPLHVAQPHTRRHGADLRFLGRRVGGGLARGQPQQPAAAVCGQMSEQ